MTAWHSLTLVLCWKVPESMFWRSY